jgi:hypothetical protein
MVQEAQLSMPSGLLDNDSITAVQAAVADGDWRQRRLAAASRPAGRPANSDSANEGCPPTSEGTGCTAMLELDAVPSRGENALLG